MAGSAKTSYEEWAKVSSNRIRPFNHLLLLAVVLVLATGIYWADKAVLDEVTRGEGRVIPSTQVQVIQNLEGGIVEELSVREGDVVQKGDVVIRLSDTQFISDAKQNRYETLYLLAKIARLEAEVAGKPYTPPKAVAEERTDFAESEAYAYQVRKSEFEGVLAILDAQRLQRQQELVELKMNLKNLEGGLSLARREMEIAEEVRRIKVMSEIEMVRLKRQQQDLLTQYEASKAAIPRIESTINEIDHKVKGERLSFVAKATQELSEARAMLSKSEEQQSILNDRLSRTEIRSPVYGVVKRIKVNTVGGVIQPGMEIMEVVPLDDQLLIEARIRPADIGFLRPDQKAMIKFTAYDPTIYGGISAQLEQISADTIIDEKGERYYRVRLRTDKNALGSEENPLPIITGMTATVELLTGHKTVLDYLLKPILKAQQNALRER
ncbi:MAG: HlyD family type I secretion periplasmic adaptor subunit [Gammaproteobacteria bacterium]|jgi:adhesin transport system membrane fusion protein|nr:HlyD family type I secretion periplasmic adaptor subunit [Gammaproteobacteria bacterium]MBT3490026.1 HlyD family type I secretion periplasmic adaptor subunit [Gammaproteobacteria bacterium]MBT3718004.1 HlyD family type I secretion periplasmic adaptor subunit [Gammaproteobacteria bacterium]MBT3844684.1 HlyD family type I secretion periplasmic adaptor subunit [Gammaproteobacteria bacterium]MBT3894396.1 HlyD family type I secretion periplasmic adaptor subunit [Gammaproteobacteria bacterium]